MSNNIEHKKVLLIGTGYMAREYSKVLKNMDVDFYVIGNSKANSVVFQNETGIPVYSGGIEKYLYNYEIPADIYVINAANVSKLGEINKQLIKKGCKHILSEKPGITRRSEGLELLQLSEDVSFFIAYNRRFYSSSIEAQKIIQQDGGVTSFSIEFTEWTNVFETLANPDYLDILVLANSSHVIDLAFFLSGGNIENMTTIVKGQNRVDWHKCGSVFAGVGTTNKNQVFTYSANWNAPGRWGVELNTEKHRLIFRPLERLQIQDKGSVKIYEPDIDYDLDNAYKPGLYREVEEFFKDNDSGRLCTLEEQVHNLDNYSRISGEVY
ncbi:Gfo/Idh/MocA family oxidoreductase [Butyrivibrio sp. AE2032]|uniref:Gfo/Idh/MocA family oxidoreductase n=1 Tax=Butyrivibrio sp. AE2032 TaxID=1458463 RepID=UPI0006923C09|nr:Gfo/Idh/MocA family oxidoreductase [Butyrivibrio sp. AE2032]